MKQQDKFTYNYTSPTKNERREIEYIKNSYSEKSQEETSLERLRKLDAKVKNPPMIIGLTLGICGILIFGLGLTMILEWNMMLFGIIVMLIGCVPMAVAYPVYNLIFSKNKKKYGDEILKISAKLLDEPEAESAVSE